MADSTLLWIGERFDADSEAFEDVTRLAQRWGAAVELLHLEPEESQCAEVPEPSKSDGGSRAENGTSVDYDGGVEDDGPESDDDGGVHGVQERLVEMGRAGGQMTIRGGDEQIMEQIRGRGQYALVVIGSLFLEKGEASRKRMTRELAMAIRDRLKAPVVTEEELRARWLFGKAQAFKLVAFAALIVLIYVMLFTHQEPILNFLAGPTHEHMPWLASVAVALTVPVIAYLYGTVSGLVLKLLNID